MNTNAARSQGGIESGMIAEVHKHLVLCSGAVSHEDCLDSCFDATEQTRNGLDMRLLQRKGTNENEENNTDVVETSTKAGATNDKCSGDAEKQTTKKTDVENQKPVDLDLNLFLGKMPRKSFYLRRISMQLQELRLPEGVTVHDALRRVLCLPSVGSKRYLTNKVDRSVTGLVAQQQCVGPLHTPLADVAVIALSYFETVGSATAIGEQPIKGLVSPECGARMSLGEALTNLVFAKITDLKVYIIFFLIYVVFISCVKLIRVLLIKLIKLYSKILYYCHALFIMNCHVAKVWFSLRCCMLFLPQDVKCSGNWMWPAKLPGEGAAMFDACCALCRTMKKLGVAIDGGKDSLSMAARVGSETVKAAGAYKPFTETE